MDTYDREGRPITMEEWARLHANWDYRVVARTQVGVYLVSTVWLGTDHGWQVWRGGPPIIFETMVFADLPDGPPGDLECQRYSTEAEAHEGHQATVLLLRATVQEEPPHTPEGSRRDGGGAGGS